ncbi:effector-associated constant component EACC1 [Sinosporangium siamense]|uniref:Uncharacterized protein n=1 Tax=Sinosporangium siamense TaxID=1367973 RepID=A0A919RN21_9ACTN|nr:hypothetical protein Ssi02_61010 [Sinosporangium siamense]
MEAGEAIVLLLAGGSVANVAFAAYSAWRHARRHNRDVAATVRANDGREIKLTRDHLKDPDMLRELISRHVKNGDVRASAS